MKRLLLLMLAGFSLLAQEPREAKPVAPGNSQGLLQALISGQLANEIGLTDEQKVKLFGVLRQNRMRLLQLRREAARHESDLELALSADTVDEARVNTAIDNLSKARAELTRAVSTTTLQMRQVLSGEQWRQLQQMARRRGRLLDVP